MEQSVAQPVDRGEKPRDAAPRRSRVVRYALLLAVAAAAVYGSFILVMLQRSQGAM